MSSTKINLGKVALTPKGEWNASTTYERLDVVSYQGSSYTVLKECTGQTPSEGEYYSLLASKGLKGDDGKDFILEGGTAGQILQKESSETNAVEWVNPNSNINLLDNWYFADPINQKSFTTYNKPGYTIDRWFIYMNHDATLSVTERGVLFKPNTPSIVHLQQIVSSLIDGHYTLSLLLGDGTLHSTVMEKVGDEFIFRAKLHGEPCVGLQNFDSSRNLYTFFLYAKAEISIIAVKLEYDSKQTLARLENGKWVLNDPPPNKAMELLTCQRYYFNTNSSPCGKAGLYNYIGPIFVREAKTIRTWFPLPTPMRIPNPVAKLTGQFSLQRVNGSTGAGAYTSEVCPPLETSITGNICSIQFSTYSGDQSDRFYTGDILFMTFHNRVSDIEAGIDGYLELDANL